MDFHLRDFRCFHNPKSVKVRAINLLVGENSAGKTSFQAALRFTLEFLRRTSQPSFNKEPFYLGAYDQIAHYRGGRFGRAKSFSFELSGEIPKGGKPRHQLELFNSRSVKTESSRFSIKLGFQNYKSQSAVESVEVFAAPYKLILQASEEKIAVKISTPSVENYTFKDVISGVRIDFIQDVAAYIDFVLRDLRYLAARANQDGGNPDEQDRFYAEVAYFSDIYRRIQRVLPTHIYASAPVRSKPERTYNVQESNVTADGGHIPFVLAELHSFEPERWAAIEEAMQEFGKASGLYDQVQVRRIGASASGPFQILVHQAGLKSNIVDVGYGVSQALPIIADVLRFSKTFFLLQQPEVHLHPKAQAELGSFIARIAKKRDHTVFIETHSDYLLDRIRMEVREGRIPPEDVAILYFEKMGHDVDIHSLEIDRVGNVVGAPPGYRKFFLEEEVRSLGIKLD